MSSQKSYLKLQFVDFQLEKDIDFDNEIKNGQLLRMLVNVVFQDRKIAFFQFLTNQNKYFFQKTSKWEAIPVAKDSHLASDSLSIQILIVKKQKINIENVFEIIAQAMQSQKIIKNDSSPNNTFENQKKYINMDVIFKSKLVNIPLQKFIKSQNINHEISLDIFSQREMAWLRNKMKSQIKQNQKKQVPKTNSKNNLKHQQNQTKLDDLSKQEEQNLQEEKRKKQELQNRLIERKLKQRFGVLNFKMTYLPRLKYQIQFRKFTLETKIFAKQYKLQIRQSAAQKYNFQDNRSQASQQDFNQRIEDITIQAVNEDTQVHQNKQLNEKIKSLKNKKSSSKFETKWDGKKGQKQLEVLFHPEGWNKFQNRESFKQPILLPLTLQGNKDGVEFVFQFFEKTQMPSSKGQQQKNESSKGPQLKTNENKKGNQKKKRNSDMKLRTIQNQSENTQQKKKINLKLSILSKIIALEKISKIKKGSTNFIPEKLVFRHNNEDFRFSFQFKLTVQTKAKEQHQNQNI